MKKKRPQQQATPPTKELKILAVKRSPKHVEPPQEQSAAVSIEQPVVDAASAPESVNKGVGSRESGVGTSWDENSDPAQDNRPNEEGNREENRLPTPHERTYGAWWYLLP